MADWCGTSCAPARAWISAFGRDNAANAGRRGPLGRSDRPHQQSWGNTDLYPAWFRNDWPPRPLRTAGGMIIRGSHAMGARNSAKSVFSHPTHQRVTYTLRCFQMASCKIMKSMKKINPIFLLLVFPALYACTAKAQSNSVSGNILKGQLRNRRIKFTKYKLANGLRVLLAPDEVESSIAINISFDAGSRKENPEQAGVANLLQNILVQNLRQIRGEMLTPFEGVVNQERARSEERRVGRAWQTRE